MARAKPASRVATVDTVLAALKRSGTATHKAGHARYGIVAPKAFGVPMGEIQKLAKGFGKSHALAAKLWASGWYEARMMAAYVEEVDKVTAAQMDAWCEDFADWSVCDTLCFALFDRTPHAFAKIKQWHTRDEEFIKRAAFVLLASVALHSKENIDAELLRALPYCEAGASDPRNFVKKGVSWAVRAIGVRNMVMHQAAMKVGVKLAASADATARWIGKDVVKDLERPLVAARLARKAAKATPASSRGTREGARRRR